MTDEEALTIVNDVIEKAKITPTVEDYSLWETIREALEKQTVKRIIVHTESPVSFTVLCPSCRAVLFKRITQDGYIYPRRIYNRNNWCLTCGQHITWEEWEDEE